MGTTPARSNFGFLAEHHDMLVALGGQAESVFHVDPVSSITKVRLFAELLAQLAAARCGLFVDRKEPQLELLRRLRDRSIISGEIDQAFHAIRKAGNAAAHDNAGSSGEALSQLRLARSLAIWFHRTFSRDRTFQPPPFVVPRAPEDATATLRAELAALKAALASAHETAGQATRAAEDAKDAARVAHEAAFRGDLLDRQSAPGPAV